MSNIEADQLYEGGTLADMLIDALQRYPDRVAFECEGEPSVSYREFGDLIGRAVTTFRLLDLNHGDAVVQLSGNSPETFALMAAAYTLGLRSTTLNALGGIADHRFIIADAQAKLVVMAPAYADQAAELTREGTIRFLAHGEGIPGMADFWSLADGLAPVPLVVEAAASDVVRVAYTGGTTGRPKGVMLTHRSLVAQAIGTMIACRGVSDQRFLCAAPISHAAGALVVPVLATGGTVILQHGFEPARFLRGVERHRATMTMLVPTMIAALVDHPGRSTADLSSLALILYGAAPMAADRIRAAMRAFGPILVQSYGQSEAPSTVLLLDRDDHRHPDPTVLASAGRPYPGVKIALLDDDDQPVPQGGIGELCVRGALVMAGYQNQPDQTAAALRNGWLHTGDLARQDAHGFYYLVDRKKDVIVTGGFNVYPAEVEAVIATCAGVAAVAVIGAPDDRWGEAVTAMVVPSPGALPDVAAIRAAVRASKGAVAIPKEIKLCDDLPLTSLGKIDKKALRAPFWLGRDRSVN